MVKRRLLSVSGIFLLTLSIFTLLDLAYKDECSHLISEVGSTVSLGSDLSYTEESSVPGIDYPAEAPEVPEVKKGYYIYINLDNCMMYVYNNGELIKTYPVSGGKPRTPSPLGTWKIIAKDTWGEGFGGAWLAFNVPWGKYGIHGTVEPWFVGKSNQSKGCIRMKNSDVRELYKIVPQGTIVRIEQKNRIFRTMKSGDVGSDVLEVQKALKKLGYYQGYPDGRFGNILKNSVKKFQKDHRLYQTGVVNISTYNKILEKEKEFDNRPSPAPTPTPASTPALTPT